MNARQLLILSLALSIMALARIAEVVNAPAATGWLLWSRVGVALVLCLGATWSWSALVRQRRR